MNYKYEKLAAGCINVIPAIDIGCVNRLTQMKFSVFSLQGFNNIQNFTTGGKY
jgi:hypothetical protein